MTDPIVDEVRQARETHAARFNHDLDAIFRDLKEQEMKSGRVFVSFSKEDATPSPEVAPQPNGTIPIVPQVIPPQQTNSTTR